MHASVNHRENAPKRGRHALAGVCEASFGLAEHCYVSRQLKVLVVMLGISVERALSSRRGVSNRLRISGLCTRFGASAEVLDEIDDVRPG